MSRTGTTLIRFMKAEDSRSLDSSFCCTVGATVKAAEVVATPFSRPTRAA